MAWNRRDGLLWTLIGPAIWMALLLSVLSGRADGATVPDGARSTPEGFVAVENAAPDPDQPEERSALRAWPACPSSADPFRPIHPSEDGA